MASESETEMQSMLERLISSRNRDLSTFLPLLFGIDPDPTHEVSGQNTGNPDHNTGNHSDPDDQSQHQRDRIVLINPLTQGMVVIEGAGFDSLFRGLQSKDGQPPASKSAIEAMPSVEITEDDQGKECVICLEGYEVGKSVKEMPCKHRFHGGCIEKWLKLHGSCPVCRFKMPVEEGGGGKKSDENDDGDRMIGEREVWVSFTIGGSSRRRRNSDENGNNTEDGNGNGNENESISGDLGNRSSEMEQ